MSRWYSVWGIIGRSGEHKKVQNKGVSAGAIGRLVSALAVATGGLIVVQLGTASQGVAGLTPAMLGLGAAVLGCSAVAMFRLTTGLRGVS